MLAVIATSQKRKRDEVDEEFDAVYKAEQMERGIKYNGLSLVGQEPEPAAVAPQPVARRGFRQVFQQIVFGDVAV